MATLIDQSQISQTLAPNLLDNGGFEIWQRGTTFNGALNAQYTSDRWKNTFAGSVTVNMTQETTIVHSGTKSLKAVISANTGFWGINEVLENFEDYRGRTVTFSVWVNTTMSNVRAFIVDQASVASVSAFATNTSTWQLLTVTKTISASASALAFGVSQDVTTGVTGTCYVDDAMAVVGNGVPTYIPANFQADLARCQRYYFRMQGEAITMGQAVTSTLVAGVIRYPVPMRTTPTLNVIGTANITCADAGGGAHACTAITLNAFSTNQAAQYNFTVSSGLVAGNASGVYTQNSSGILEFIADI